MCLCMCKSSCVKPELKDVYFLNIRHNTLFLGHFLHTEIHAIFQVEAGEKLISNF